MGIESLMQARVHDLSEDEQFAVLGYIEHLRVTLRQQDKLFTATDVELRGWLRGLSRTSQVVG